jgi:hypothetical protein
MAISQQAGPETLTVFLDDHEVVRLGVHDLLDGERPDHGAPALRPSDRRGVRGGSADAAPLGQ